ncbi:MAG: glycosyltransferase N-terminal domain-containing protein [Candidatus Kaelpia aquatica]|nr:glycosyltransferase N-terminal domain-containing protein [Candidatus Kaelpia aquatica]
MKKVIPGLSFKLALDISYFLFLPFVLAIYIIRGKYHSGWLERVLFGRWRKIIKEQDRLVWIHAVSLGEAREAVLLYRKLKEERSNYKYLLTTVTEVGQKFIKQHIDREDYSTYLPLDFSFLIRRILSHLKIELVLILETELWPNFIIGLKEHGIPVGLINARISKKSFPRYKLIKAQIRKVLNQLDFVSSSGDMTTLRLASLGFKNREYIFEGNIKFDLNAPLVKRDSRIEDLSRILKQSNSKLFIAGSTHGEESIFLSQCFLKLKDSYPDWRFLIAPRQLKELEILKSFLRGEGCKWSLFSSGFQAETEQDIYIMDEVGYLPALYNLSEAVFVGGSLLSYGGHNIIEPAVFKKPILIGPYYHNFKEIVNEFLKEEAVLVVKKEDLLSSMEKIFSQQNLREMYGQRAFRVVEKNRGGLKKVIDFVCSKYI